MNHIQRRTGAWLALAALGAAGMLLGPDGWPWLGIGPFGSAVLYAALWMFGIHVAKHSEAAFPEQVSPAERQAWVAVIFALLIAFHYLNFLVALSGLGAAADRVANPVSRSFGINLGMLMFGWALASRALRARGVDAVELDERDLRIQHAASRFAHEIMVLMLLAVIASLALLPEQSRTWLRPLMAANVLLGLLLVHTLARNIHRVVRYRREHA